MKLAFRPATIPDFYEFYRACFSGESANTELRNIVKREWQAFLANLTTLTMIVEDIERQPGERIVGCAQWVFITEQFAVLIHSASLAPWLNVHATQPLSDGSSPLLDLNGVREANSGAGLTALLTRWTVAWEPLSPEDALSLRAYLHRSFTFFSRGYKLKELFVEAIGNGPRQEAERAGFRLINDYSDYYGQYPPAPAPHAHPYLLHLTREQALSSEGMLTSYDFAYTPPRFFFNFEAREQQLLRWALTGADDKTIADLLDCSIHTIHKRWRHVYQRVDSHLPALVEASTNLASTRQQGRGTKTLSQPGAGRRGLEKRRLLIQFLLEHPEELCPVNPPVDA